MPFFYLAYAPFLSVLYYYRSRFIIGYVEFPVYSTYNRTTFLYLIWCTTLYLNSCLVIVQFIRSLSKQGISELFNTYFTSVVNKLFESCRHARPVFNCTTEELFTKKRFEFTAVGKPFVLKQLKCLKPKKATGLDGLPARLLKDSAIVIADCVTHLINLSFETGEVPSEWKQAKVVPLFKSGNKDDLDNYRPISILPILSKILEKAVFHQLHSFLSENSLLSPYQSGFRANHSTQLAVTFLTDKIRGHMDKGLLTGAVFIDLKKAFDTVPHDGLLNKLYRYGIQDQPLSWFVSYLSNKTQSVSIENHLSSAANISSGVPQGSVLGPLLFILYINDLPLAVGLSSVMLYADDTVIFTAASSIDQLQLNLSLDLNNVSSWLTANGLFLNPTKTEYVLFGTRQRLIRSESHSPLCMEGKEVNQVKLFKYLGVVLDECLSFNDHISYVRSKVAGRLGLLSRLRGCLTTEAANKIYLSTVLPILSYCDTCFCPLGSTNSKSLERLQRRAAKIVYGFKSDIATETILENLRWPPLTKTMEKHCALLVNKCLVGEIPLYFKDYFMLRSQSDSQHVYNRCTRSSITDIILPKIHLDVAKKSFYYHGASLFNRLPTIIKTLPPKERFQAISSFYS